MMTLREYAKQNGITQAALADALGIKQAAVSLIMAGKNRPSLEVAVKIERITKGSVPAISWIPDDELAR